jgi:quinol-cytochrome oxidoreductase complex cytochrome b subunit
MNSPQGLTKSGRRFRRSFFLHLRPPSFSSLEHGFGNTYLLGFLAVYLFAVEGVTGIILMVYYSPTPETAYGSIIELTTRVPFGWLLRDLHRLAGEAMILVTVLHLLRVFVAGAYLGPRGITWMTGVLLLICTLLLAFSGYLLPWDQLSYWAITIGTSMAGTIPLVGDWLLLILRGGHEFAEDGLLRFYLLHILGLPILFLAALAVHYYRVVRIHGLTIPAATVPVDERSTPRRPLLPNQMLIEAGCATAATVILVAICWLLYDAPLGSHADPTHTPISTQAPWFFLWLQGGLKLGNSFSMGILWPLTILLLLFFLPIYDRGPRRPIKERPLALASLCSFTLGLTILTIMGLPHFGISHSQAETVLSEMAPEEGLSAFHRTGFEALPVGIYETSSPVEKVPQDFAALLKKFAKRIATYDRNPGIRDARGVLIVQEWQENLKKITIRLHWQDLNLEHKSTRETVVYVHRDRNPKTGQGN